MNAATRLLAFYLSCAASFTAGHVVNYAVILVAQDELRSPALAGVGFGLCFGPPLLLGWLAGVWCDRVSPTRLIHAAQAVFVVAALLLWAGDDAPRGTRIATLLGAAALAGVAWSFVAPARMTALPQLVSAARLRQGALVLNLLVMLGFGAAPLVLSFARTQGGWPAVAASAAGLFIAASALLAGVPTRGSGVVRPVRADIADGLRAVRAAPLLGALLGVAMIAYLMMGPVQVLLPLLARDRYGLGELQRGAFLGTLGPALIAGGVLALALGRRAHHGATVVAAIAVAGTCLALLGGLRDASAAAAVLAAAAVAGGLAISLVVGGLQQHAPQAARGRVMAMYTIVSQVVPAASGLLAGLLAQRLGAAAAALVCGTVLTLAAAGAWAGFAQLRRWR